MLKERIGKFMEIFTIGHSTHNKETFLEMIKSFNIEVLVDVRSYPGSKFLPHFNKENMFKWIPENGIEYKHISALGGRRRKPIEDNSVYVAGWTHIAFKNYAAYTLTEEFEKALDSLIEIAKQQRVCIMCAESVPWKCHRLIISNSLFFKNIKVIHIMGKNKFIEHKINKFGAKAEFDGNKVIYP